MLRTSLQMIAGSAVALPGLALAATSPVAYHTRDTGAQPAPRLAGEVFVERIEPAPGGGMARVLERADELHSGDRLVFVVSWTRGDPAGFVVTNPVPRSVVWQPAHGAAAEQISVDGGRSWGVLGNLMVRDGDGWRAAQPGDVTHVRWRIPAARAATGGQITYRGVVR